MESLIEVLIVKRSKLTKWQEALENDGWSPWSMHQWMYIEGKVAAMNEILQYYYANIKVNK